MRRLKLGATVNFVGLTPHYTGIFNDTVKFFWIWFIIVYFNVYDLM